MVLFERFDWFLSDYLAWVPDLFHRAPPRKTHSGVGRRLGITGKNPRLHQYQGPRPALPLSPLTISQRGRDTTKLSLNYRTPRTLFQCNNAFRFLPRSTKGTDLRDTVRVDLGQGLTKFKIVACHLGNMHFSSTYVNLQL